MAKMDRNNSRIISLNGKFDKRRKRAKYLILWFKNFWWQKTQVKIANNRFGIQNGSAVKKCSINVESY